MRRNLPSGERVWCCFACFSEHACICCERRLCGWTWNESCVAQNFYRFTRKCPTKARTNSNVYAPGGEPNEMETFNWLNRLRTSLCWLIINPQHGELPSALKQPAQTWWKLSFGTVWLSSGIFISLERWTSVKVFREELLGFSSGESQEKLLKSMKIFCWHTASSSSRNDVIAPPIKTKFLMNHSCKVKNMEEAKTFLDKTSNW